MTRAGVKSVAKKRSTVAEVQGFALVRTASSKPVTVEPHDHARRLVAKAAKALNKPGIGKDVVFGNRPASVHAYSVNPADVTQVIEESADGSQRIGRLVNGRFIAVRKAA